MANAHWTLALIIVLAPLIATAKSAKPAKPAKPATAAQPAASAAVPGPVQSDMPTPTPTLAPSALVASTPPPSASTPADANTKTDVPLPPQAPGTLYSGIWLDLPIIDAPFNFEGGWSWPSMGQSTSVSADLYSLMHFGLGKLLNPYSDKLWMRTLAYLADLAADYLTIRVPLFGGWEHEEWHRNILNSRNIHSVDGIWSFTLFGATTSIDGITDQELADLHDHHPAEATRLYEAGIEANYELATYMEKQQFFNHTRVYNNPTSLVMYVVNSLYWGVCSDFEAADANQPFNVHDRDMVGPDCTGWAYDLFHPGQRYVDRGTDPDGGVQRYQTTAASGPRGSDYLGMQLALSFLNFLDPMMVGFDWFTLPDGTRFNAHVRHQPTSFGTDTAIEAFIAKDQLQFFAVLHAYLDQLYRYRPGISLELVRYQLTQTRPLMLTARLDGWLQPPTGSVVSTTTSYAGGRAMGRLSCQFIEPFEIWLEAEFKSAGWVAGSWSIPARVAGRAGVAMPLFR